MKKNYVTIMFWTKATMAVSALAAIGIMAAAMPARAQANSTTNPTAALAAIGRSAPVTQAAEKLTAILPSGVEVELVALSFYPDMNQPWWRPDGTPLSDPPINPSPFNISSSTGQKVELVFRLGKKAAEPGYESRITFADGGGLLWTGRRSRKGLPVSDLLVVATSLQAASRTMSLDLLVGAGPWESVATSDGLQPKGTLGAAKEAPNLSDHTTLITAFFPASRQARMVATDKDGTTHIAVSAGISKAGKEADEDFLFHRLPPAQFKSFTLQTRPYEMIHLKDVATAPGQRTDAQLTSAPESAGR